MKITMKRNSRDLKIDYTMIQEGINTELVTDIRESVRGIYLKGSDILVVHSDEHLYGTPGGGVEDIENYEEALIRELKEETGALHVTVKEYLGKVNEFRQSGLYEDILFNPIQHYYLVDIETFGDQELIEYEQQMNMQCSFINIDEVIASNTKKLTDISKRYYIFYYFQTELFKVIKELFKL